MSQLFVCALALLAVLASAQAQGQGQIYEICTDHVIDASLQKFSIISPGLGTPAGYPGNLRCHIDYAQTKTPRVLRVTFPSFMVEKGEKCQKDSLRVGSSAILCGSWVQGRTMDFLVMPGKTFMFSFNTDGTNVAPQAGFIMNVQVGNYVPGQMVSVYSGRGDYYTQDYTQTVCSCGTQQASALARQYNYQPKCNCKLTHNHKAPVASPASRFRSNTNTILNTWAAGQVAKGLGQMAVNGIQKRRNTTVPTSNPYSVLGRNTMQRQQQQQQRNRFSQNMMQALALSRMLKKSSGGAGAETEAEGGAGGMMGSLGESMSSMFNMGSSSSGAESETEGGAASSGLSGMFNNMFGGQRRQFGSRWGMTTTAKPEETEGGASPSAWGQATMSDDDDESSSSPSSQPGMSNFFGKAQGSQYNAFPRNTQYHQPRANAFSQRFGGSSTGSRFPQQVQYRQQGQMQNMMGARGPQYGQAQQYGQRYGQAQQYQAPKEIATQEASPGGERD